MLSGVSTDIYGADEAQVSWSDTQEDEATRPSTGLKRAVPASDVSRGLAKASRTSEAGSRVGVGGVRQSTGADSGSLQLPPSMQPKPASAQKQQPPRTSSGHMLPPQLRGR